ncbi:hypothetical protein T439DRAFT_323164 [Meredithblackwellia eburnea MCA 4105]
MSYKQVTSAEREGWHPGSTAKYLDPRFRTPVDWKPKQLYYIDEDTGDLVPVEEHHAQACRRLGFGDVLTPNASRGYQELVTPSESDFSLADKTHKGPHYPSSPRLLPLATAHPAFPSLALSGCNRLSHSTPTSPVEKRSRWSESTVGTDSDSDEYSPISSNGDAQASMVSSQWSGDTKWHGPCKHLSNQPPVPSLPAKYLPYRARVGASGQQYHRSPSDIARNGRHANNFFSLSKPLHTSRSGTADLYRDHSQFEPASRRSASMW